MMKVRQEWRKYGKVIGWASAALLILGSLYVFIELAGDVWLKEGFAWDVPLMLAIHSIASPLMDTLMRIITRMGGLFAYLLMAGVALWLWQRSCRLEAVFMLVSASGAGLISSLLKRLFARPRPEVFVPLVTEHTYSFPSGHTMTAVAVYGTLAVLLWLHRRYFWGMISAIWIPAVAFSRIYLGAHYPSDVLGALSAGLIWLTFVVIGYRWWQRPADPAATNPPENTG